MRIAGRLTAGAAVTGMIVMGCIIAPAAQAASTAADSSIEAPTAQAAPPPATRSRWAELANAATGADLWSRSSVQERPMGSITKVMTAYVVLTTPGLNLNQVITVPGGIVAYDETYDASTAGLRPGEKLTTLQLLYAMLLPSGCDAAYTLADAYGPGLTAFIAEMNATARKLGLAKTHFTDFSGLPDPTENLYLLHGARPDRPGAGRDEKRYVRGDRGDARVQGRGQLRPSRARMEERRFAARELPGGDRHQDRVHARGRAVPAVRGETGEHDPDWSRARLVRS